MGSIHGDGRFKFPPKRVAPSHHNLSDLHWKVMGFDSQQWQLYTPQWNLAGKKRKVASSIYTDGNFQCLFQFRCLGILASQHFKVTGSIYNNGQFRCLSSGCILASQHFKVTGSI